MQTIELLRGTSAQWAADNPIIPAGVQVYETDTHRFKIGDGYSRYIELDSFIPAAEIQAAIEEAIANAVPSGGTSSDALTIHINSETPHPVYDEGPSFALLYENAKV